MLYLENNTTFSGSDIRVYVYKNIDDFDNLGFSNKVDGNRVKRKKDNFVDPINPSNPNMFDGIPFNQMNQVVDQRLEQSGLGNSNLNTSKVNPNYIDIIKTGSDKKAIEAARTYEMSKLQTSMNRNAQNSSGKNIETKPIIELGSVYSITYSSYREKIAIRTLGRVSAKDYTKGQRTIAGSMNFAVFQSHELMDFLKVGDWANDIVLLDQLPKFNMMLLMLNEYGGASILHLFGVTIATESQQTSVEDLALMNNVTFYAEDIMTIENVGNLFETSLAMLHPTIIAGRSLQFYNKNQSTTLEDLLEANQGQDSKISQIISRSRGLF